MLIHVALSLALFKFAQAAPVRGNQISSAKVALETFKDD